MSAAPGMILFAWRHAMRLLNKLKLVRRVPNVRSSKARESRTKVGRSPTLIITIRGILRPHKKVVLSRRRSLLGTRITTSRTIRGPRMLLVLTLPAGKMIPSLGFLVGSAVVREPFSKVGSKSGKMTWNTASRVAGWITAGTIVSVVGSEVTLEYPSVEDEIAASSILINEGPKLYPNLRARL